MKRSHFVLVLGVVGLGIVSLAVLLTPPLVDNTIRPTATPTVLAVRATISSAPQVTPVEIIQATATTARLSTPLPLPSATAIRPSQTSTASAELSTSTLTPENTPKPTTIALAEASLVRVIDGDTLEVSVAGRTERVRLIGVHSPETNGPPICYGQEATAHAHGLLTEVGASIWLEKDISETDRYGRLLRYVWLDPGRQRMLDEQMVAGGYAQVSTYPPDVKYVDRFLSAERTARAEGRGLWGACEYFGAPLPTSTALPQPTAQPTTSTPGTAQPPAARTTIPSGDLPYDPNGPDRDCPDFATHDEAQRFFIAAGGPARDPHRLDGDHDGLACETLP